METIRKKKAERKSFLLKLLLFFLSFQPLGAFSINLEISVTSAGNLVNQVDLAQIGQIDSITLHGELNGTDILVIRKMKGLKYLDMTETKIVNGGNSYYDEYISSENTIGSYFFDNPNLTTIKLPNTITSIGAHAFDGFASLTDITISNSVKEIGPYAFNKCTGLTDITIPNSVVDIRSSAFEGCTGLINLTIPESVETIDASAFSYCRNLKNVYFKETDSPLSISLTAFSYDQLEKIELGRNLIYDSQDYESPFARKSSLKYVVIKPSMTSISRYLCYACDGIEEIVIPNSVKTIGRKAFSNCSSLKKVVLESGDAELKLYGDESSNCTLTFDGCPLEEVFLGRTLTLDYRKNGAFSLNTGKLTSLTISDNVTKISEGDFSGSNIERLTIPKSVQKIDYYAFSDCYKLKVVILEDGQTELKISGGSNYLPVFGGCHLDSLHLGRNLSLEPYYSNPFENDTTLRTVTIGDSVSIIPARTFAGCINLKSIQIANSVSTIEEGAFKGCEKLSSVTLPQSITSISQDTFHGCTDLQSIEIPNTVQNIEFGAFYDCKSLTTAVLPKGMTYIGGNAFRNCKSLKTINFPDSLKNIDGSAFYNCVGLTSLTIPSSVINIGGSAFHGCVGLLEINAQNTLPPTIQESTFDTVTYAKAVLNVPLNCKTIYWLHPYWENFHSIMEKDFPTTGIADNVFETTACGYKADNYGITFTKGNESVKIYTIQGILLYDGKVSIGQRINLAPNTVYIVKVGKQTTKVAF